MIRAIIDIGTNTAHVLIADVHENQIVTYLFKQRFYTFLGDGGLHKINQPAIEKLFFALDEFQKAIVKYKCTAVHVIATEGLRSAHNGSLIYKRIKTKYNWSISIISGDDEAEAIYRGVQLSTDLTKGSFLIMDIGGGSVEFIKVRNGQKEFQKSYPIGISRLYEEFHESDPCSDEDILRMNNKLDIQLYEMWNNIKDHQQKTKLVGCAGTFEVFLSQKEGIDHHFKASLIPTKKLEDLLKKVVNKDLKSRGLVKDLPEERAKYIVVALALIKYVTDHLSNKEFLVSKYALKEGAIVMDKYF